MPKDAATAETDLRVYPRIIRRRRWWVVGITLAALAGAIVYSLVATKEYSATAQVVLQPQSGSISFINGTNQNITPTDVTTELQLLSSASIADAVEAKLHMSRIGVKTSEVGTTNVLSVTSTNHNPVLAARIANDYVNVFITDETAQALHSVTTAELQLTNEINTIDAQLPAEAGTPQGTALGSEVAVLKGEFAELQIYGAETSGGVEVVSSAVPPKTPSSPKKTEDALIGLLVGLVAGIGMAFVVDYVDDAAYSREDLERAAPNIPVMGVVPMVNAWKNKSKPLLISVSEPTSPASESYRSLRTSLKFASKGRSAGSIVVTSATAGEGKTSTVSNLGVVMAKGGQRTVLVSADLRRPRLAGFFSLDETVGLTSVVIGDIRLDEALQRVEDVPGLAVLAAGPIPPNPAELLENDSVAEILGMLKDRFDVVIVDSPPLFPVTDPMILAALTDVTLLVVAAGKTKRSQIKQAREKLAQLDDPLVGIVLNEVTRETGYGYGYEYSYAYKYQARNVKTDLDDPVASHNGQGPQGGSVTSEQQDTPQKADL